MWVCGLLGGWYRPSRKHEVERFGEGLLVDFSSPLYETKRQGIKLKGKVDLLHVLKIGLLGDKTKLAINCSAAANLGFKRWSERNNLYL